MPLHRTFSKISTFQCIWQSHCDDAIVRWFVCEKVCTQKCSYIQCCEREDLEQLLFAMR